jgi:carbonic anhydrase/acetyltransferase-like protein (isoleucine patch superfamily)
VPERRRQRRQPGAVAVGLIVRGLAQEQADNSAGAAGDVTVESQPGVFPFANSAAGDAITRAEIGDDCYIVDDSTVAKTNPGGNTRSVAGKIVDVDAKGVWVRIGF